MPREVLQISLAYPHIAESGIMPLRKFFKNVVIIDLPGQFRGDTHIDAESRLTCNVIEAETAKFDPR
jgi:hypothetical protein